MKVLDSSELHSGSTESRNVDLTKYRKKKKRSKHLVKLLILLAVIIVFAVVWLNADTIFEPLRGIASKVDTKTSYTAEFPIELPGSGSYSFQKLGDSFLLLTDTYLYAYDTSGAQLYALKHGYSIPCAAANEKRVILYDRSGYNFAVYSKTSLMYAKAVDDKIIYAAVGSDNMYAVVTDSQRYSNVLYIYDDSGNWKYTRKFADENIMQTAFTGDGEHIIVSTLCSSDGDIVTTFYKFSVKTPDNYIWKYSVRGSMPCGLYSDKKTAVAVCDDRVLSLDISTGELNGSYPYTGTLRDFAFTESSCVLYYNDISTSRDSLILLDSSAEAVSAADISSSATCVQADAEGIYVLEGAKMMVWDAELMNEKAVQLENKGFTEFIKIDDSLILLGYDTLDKTEL